MLRVLILLLTVSACAPRMVRNSARNPDLFEKEGDKLSGNSRPIGDTSPNELYVKEKKKKLKSDHEGTDAGSLMNLKNAQNFLATGGDPFAPGSIIKVQVKSQKKPEGESTGAKKPDDKAKEDTSLDALEAEILKSLPELTPAEKGTTKLIDALAMRVVSKLENGDLLLEGKRTSLSNDEKREIKFKAVLPARLAYSTGKVSTNDLEDVEFSEVSEGEMYERTSLVWEDGYTLRASGFTEAKSKAAQLLSEQRKQVGEATKKLEQRLKAVSEERREVMKLKDDLTQKESAANAKIAELEAKVKEQEPKNEDAPKDEKTVEKKEKPSAK